MPNFIDNDRAAARLKQAGRVLVIGCSGGGKSTLSRKIAARFGHEYQSLDRDVFWLPGWRKREMLQQRRSSSTSSGVSAG
ncbi:adenylate kinase family enzyme [Rhizobium halophytocola]|uniref:Adenylate kinase family enzyme n=1 Tax=Rhizobium halophytocola TaxID=735519 RepID=A0ABS4DWG0_9HYPH|nr:adenylate kinase family enzyme [Rhizobium halophytocola]